MGLRDRILAAYVTGPLGHFVAGALDIALTLAAWAWMRVRIRLGRLGRRRRPSGGR